MEASMEPYYKARAILLKAAHASMTLTAQNGFSWRSPDFRVVFDEIILNVFA